jgi:hypothetical protein
VAKISILSDSGCISYIKPSTKVRVHDEIDGAVIQLKINPDMSAIYRVGYVNSDSKLYYEVDVYEFEIEEIK